MLQRAVNYLVSGHREQVFYAHLAARATWTIDRKCPTMGVSVGHGIAIRYNPEFMAQFPVNVQAGIIQHELNHVILRHTLPGLYANALDKHMLNVAMDMVVNQFIPKNDLPKEAIFVEDFGYPLGLDVPQYYELLMRDFSNKSQKMGGNRGPLPNTVDDHSDFGKTPQDSVNDGVTEEMQVKAIKQAIVDAAEKTKAGSNAGSVPAHVETVLEALKEPKINWKRVLRNFVVGSVKANRIKTRKRVNRRYGLQYAGSKRDTFLKLAVPIDSSGSVSDASISAMFGELEAMANSMPIKIIVIEADCEVRKVFTFKPGDKYPVLGRGGTAYQPALDKAAELGVDAIIYMGDGDCADTPIKPRVPFMWAMVQNGNPPVNWGKTIRID